MPLRFGTILVAAAALSAPAAAQSTLYVSNEGDATVGVVDLATGRMRTAIPVGGRPRGIQLSRDGTQVLVAVSDDRPHTQGTGDAITVIGVSSRRVLGRTRGGTDPEQFGVSPDGRWLYASNEDAGTLTITDRRTGRPHATLVVGIEPEGVAVSPDGRWVYVTAETSNTVSVLDTRVGRIDSSFLVDLRPRAAAFSPDGSRAYVTNEISGSLSVVDVARHEVVATVEMERGEGKPVGVVVSPDGRRVYVANGRTSAVTVIDAAALRVIGRIPVGRRPWGVALSRDGSRLYTANGLSNDVSVIDTRAGRVISTIPVGRRPWGLALGR